MRIAKRHLRYHFNFLKKIIRQAAAVSDLRIKLKSEFALAIESSSISISECPVLVCISSRRIHEKIVFVCSSSRILFAAVRGGYTKKLHQFAEATRKLAPVGRGYTGKFFGKIGGAAAKIFWRRGAKKPAKGPKPRQVFSPHDK